jgi:hypothetical protein
MRLMRRRGGGTGVTGLRVQVIVILITAIIGIPSASVIFFVQYGTSNRPIGEYATDFLPEYYLAYPSQVMSFRVDLRNKGTTDIVVQIIINATNALVGFNETGPFYPIISLTSVNVDGNSPWTPTTFYFKINSDASLFTISCSVSKTPDYSTFTHVVATIFGEIGHDS